LRKTCPGATLPTTNLTSTELVSNPGLFGEKPSTELRAETCAKAQVDVPRSAKPFLRFTASLDSVKIHLKYNWDRAYTNEFPVACEELDVGNLRTIAREVIRLIRGHTFGWKDFWDSNQGWSRLKLHLE